MTREWCAYVRVSKVGDRKGDNFHSPDQQEEAIRAAAPGPVRAKAFVDLNVSGTQMERKFLDEALAWVREDPTRRGLAVYDYSRLARNLRGFLELIDDLDAIGAAVLSVNERLDTSTPEGRLMVSNFAALNEFTSRNMGRRWRSVRARRAEKGLRPGGTARFGYTATEPAKPDVVDPVTGPVLRELYLRYTNGQAFLHLARWVNRLGHRTPRGNEWVVPSLSRCLDSGFGAGYVKNGGERLLGLHQPVITQDEWGAYLRARRERSTLPKKSSAAQWYLAGLVHCAECGGPMRREKQYVACTRRRGGKTCVGARAPQVRVDFAVTTFLAARVDELAAGASTGEDIQRARNRTLTARERETALEGALARAARGWADELLDDASYRAVRADLEADLARARAERLAASDALARLTATGDVYEQLLTATEDMPVTEWNTLVRRVVTRVEVTRDKRVSVS